MFHWPPVRFTLLCSWPDGWPSRQTFFKLRSGRLPKSQMRLTLPCVELMCRFQDEGVAVSFCYGLRLGTGGLLGQNNSAE